MTPSKRLKREIAYHAQVAHTELMRGREILGPELKADKSTYIMSSVEARRIDTAIKHALKCVEQLLVKL